MRLNIPAYAIKLDIKLELSFFLFDLVMNYILMPINFSRLESMFFKKSNNMKIYIFFMI